MAESHHQDNHPALPEATDKEFEHFLEFIKNKYFLHLFKPNITSQKLPQSFQPLHSHTSLTQFPSTCSLLCTHNPQ